MRRHVAALESADMSAHTKYTSGTTITMLVILMRNDSEIAIAATKNDEDSPCSTLRRKKYNPTIAKLSDGTSGMNERPAKTFSGVKQKKKVAQTAAVLPKISRTSKKKNGNETANKMIA